MPTAKEIADMLDIGRNTLQVISVVFFTSKIAKIAQDKCSHCAMALDYCFQLLSTTRLHRMVAQWVHPLRLWVQTPCVVVRLMVGALLAQYTMTRVLDQHTLNAESCFVKHLNKPNNFTW